MLHQLVNENAFISEVPGRRLSYRYHHLFLELLRAELHRQLPRELLLVSTTSARAGSGRTGSRAKRCSTPSPAALAVAGSRSAARALVHVREPGRPRGRCSNC
jgi:hypothetical protein